MTGHSRISSAPLFEYQQPTGLRFSKDVTEVAIFDKHGTPVWSARLAPTDHPSWNGKDRFGVLADAGTYLCRIRDHKGETYYVPFVLIR